MKIIAAIQLTLVFVMLFSHAYSQNNREKKEEEKKRIEEVTVKVTDNKNDCKEIHKVLIDEKGVLTQHWVDSSQTLVVYHKTFLLDSENIKKILDNSGYQIVFEVPVSSKEKMIAVSCQPED